MDEPTKFLADRLLSQERPITYRELSRALNVHVNTAKGLLYDFNKCQNARRPGSIHATYLLAGVKSLKVPPEEADDMPSSSAPESPAKPTPIMTLTLVGEEKLEDVLREYREVTSIHIYSLAAGRQTDVALLADIANSVSEALKDEAPSDTSKYGTITNPLVRRRRDPRASLGGGSKPVRQGRVAQVVKAEKEETLSDASSKDATNPTATTRRNSTPKAIQQEKSQPEKGQTIKSEKQGSAEPSVTASKAPTTKRSNSGNIMQSFAKAASKPRAKPKSPPKEESPAAALSDDGEADDSDVLPPSNKKSNAAAVEAAMKSRKDRADELKRMMEEDDDDDGGGDDDDVDDVDDEPDAKDKQVDEDEEMVDVSESKPEEKVAEEVASSGNGRRRGRRRVMKKKRILDEQGYMVTIQEAGWESFSEEDSTPQPPAKKPTPSSTPSSTTGTTKGKKAAGKGNIMSFFSKK
ncbi:hypothetical protein CP532_1555 [Ophiocordyceps camponoti-leonardi (nom. inval.)]|nr:hypothetical protein CP532_1555 [Ophiocordyceps camponoti-leonardi (nom. inval.)]